MFQPGEDILDTSRLMLYGDFGAQVGALLQRIRLSRPQVEGLCVLFDDLQSTLQERWPGCKVYPFGSIVTGLGIQTSDVDCFVSLPPQFRNNSSKKRDPIVYIAKNLLADQYHLFTELTAIPMAKVPIVKFFHIPTQRHCDVNFKSPSGVENTKLIAYLLHIHRMALDLAIIIKFWSKIHSLTGTNLMPNYTLTMLVIFFLQQECILPSVRQIQSGMEPYIIDRWNTVFDESFQFCPLIDKSLYELLGSFFQYYNEFGFGNFIISPYIGSPINKNVFKKVETVPDDFMFYKHNLNQGACMPLKLDTMICVQDPFEHCRNCSVAVFPRLAEKFQILVRQAAQKFKEVPRDDFLRMIFMRRPDLDVPAPKIIPRPNRIQKPKQAVAQRKKVKHTILNVFQQYRRKR